MWIHCKNLLWRSYHLALAEGSSTGISVWLLGFGVITLGFAFTVFIEWLVNGRNMPALKMALQSWTAGLGALLALFVAWVLLFGYSVARTIYLDHQNLVAAANRACVQTKETPKAAPVGIKVTTPPSRQRVNTTIKQGGQHNTANPGVNAAPITQGPCGVIQNGGSNNTAAPNCGTPAWKLTDTQVKDLETALAGTRVNFNTCSSVDDSEAARLAAQLRYVLTEAGWNPTDKGPDYCAMDWFEGIILRVSNAEFPAVKALQNQLVTAGIKAPGAFVPEVSPNTVEIRVGHQPKPQ